MTALQNEANPFRKQALKQWLTKARSARNAPPARSSSSDDLLSDDASALSHEASFEEVELRQDDDENFWDISSDDLHLEHQVSGTTGIFVFGV